MSRANLIETLSGLIAGLFITFILVRIGVLTAIVHATHIPLTWIGMVTGILIASVVNALVTHRIEKK